MSEHGSIENDGPVDEFWIVAGLLPRCESDQLLRRRARTRGGASLNPHPAHVPGRLLLWLFVFFSAVGRLGGQESGFPAERKARLESAVRAALGKAGAPGAQVGVLEHGRVVYAGAFGSARLAGAASAGNGAGGGSSPVTQAMPFRIGSVSKQFTAAAVMVLVEEGKVRLDDPIATWFPEMGHAREVTLRQLLNQVSGLSDYYTEDYLTPEMAAASAPMEIAQRWTGKPLDFAPGTKWQYSNTNYLLAALIVEKVAGEPFFSFLERRVLGPAGVEHAINLEASGVPALPQGYFHYGFGPAREVPLEGRGTLLGAAELGMPVGDLLLWDRAVMERKVLTAASWQTMEAEAALPDGTGTGYGMGYFLEADEAGGGARRAIAHDGEVNGFTTDNKIYPASGTAIAVTINAESGVEAVFKAVEEVVFAPTAKAAVPHDVAAERLVKTVLGQLQQGRVDRALLAPNLDFFFTPQVLADYRSSLAPMGAVKTLTPLATEERGGMRFYFFRAQGSGGPVVGLSVYVTKDGKLDQMLLEKMD